MSALPDTPRKTTGTHPGRAEGLPPPTGRVLRMTGATIHDFDENARLTGHWQIADRLGIFRQLAGDA